MAAVGTAIDMALRWCLGVQLQLERVAEAESDVAATLWDRPSLGTEEGQRRFARLRIDTHLLLVAARNLLRALDDLSGIATPTPVEAAVPANLAAQVKTLRDCLEHWDQRQNAHLERGIEGRAYRVFARDYPDDDPGSYTFGDGGTKVGGLDLSALREATGRSRRPSRRRTRRLQSFGTSGSSCPSRPATTGSPSSRRPTCSACSSAPSTTYSTVASW